MDANQYQSAAAATAQYPGCLRNGGLAYLALKMCGEAGEVAEFVGKRIRNRSMPITPNDDLMLCGNADSLSDEERRTLAFELGDVLWYVAETANALGYSLNDVMTMNIEKLAERAKKGTIDAVGKRE